MTDDMPKTKSHPSAAEVMSLLAEFVPDTQGQRAKRYVLGVDYAEAGKPDCCVTYELQPDDDGRVSLWSVSFGEVDKP